MKTPFDIRGSKRTRQEDRDEALQRKKSLLEKMAQHLKVPREPDMGTTHKGEKQAPTPEVSDTKPLTVVEQVGKVNISLYRDNEDNAAALSPALSTLVNCYLRAARERTRHIFMLWPVAPHALTLVHAIATMERWGYGYMQGIRGLVAPVKANAFHPLNHLHTDPNAVLALAQCVYEQSKNGNSEVMRSNADKATFLIAMASVRKNIKEDFKPTLGELIPHFLAVSDKSMWPSCSTKLLGQTRAKLSDRSHAKGLAGDILKRFGEAGTAPDAIFALDLRMTKEDRKRALRQLKSAGAPEVILINATRKVRMDVRGWGRHLAHFIADVEDVMGEPRPGVLIVVDDPQAAYQMRNDLETCNKDRLPQSKWTMNRDFHIDAACNGLREDGLLPAGCTALPLPAPREFDVAVVDTDAANVASQLYRIGHRIQGGAEAAKPVIEAAKYLTKLSALPCGMKDIEAWLSDIEVGDRDRQMYSWAVFEGAARRFAAGDEANDERVSIERALEKGTSLFTHYQEATPFALRLAELVLKEARGKGCVVVFSNSRHRSFAVRYWERVGLGEGVAYPSIKDKVRLLMSSKLDEVLDDLRDLRLIFVGLDDTSLRLVMLDNRIPKHSAILLTQRGAQYLRRTLKPLHDKFDEFRVIKPRMASLLRGFEGIPEGGTILIDDFTLPAFRSDMGGELRDPRVLGEDDPEAWEVVLEGGMKGRWRCTHAVYVYDPTHHESGRRGFYPCEVGSLKEGDRVFVMSHDLRDKVEGVLRDAGVPVSHDKPFEAMFREYQDHVIRAVHSCFPGDRLADQARNLRRHILTSHPELAKGFPEDGSVRYWISHIDARNKPFEELKTCAPRELQHFKAFGEALQMPELMIAFYWQQVILAIRNARRVDGRHVSDIYSYMLFQPESAMLHHNISAGIIRDLFEEARDSTYSVESVNRPVTGAHHV